jgi:hypothetical protein
VQGLKIGLAGVNENIVGLGYAKPHTTTATVMSQMNSFDVG